ncbi:MAG: hypothetical protein AAF564_12975 [Bacteroidota bacterium]
MTSHSFFINHVSITSVLNHPQAPPTSVPPSHLKGANHYNFGEAIFGKCAQAIESFFEREGRLENTSDVSLAKQIRAYVYNHDSRKKYVATATDYLKKKQPDLGVDYDVILVGAGIHAAIFLYTLRKKNPTLRVLIVEKSGAICATFFRLGDALVLNSPTFSKVGLNANVFEGHFIQVSDFDELVEKPFPTAKHLYELATMALFHADADILFDFEVEDVKKVHGGYSVSSKNKIVNAGSIVISNGMGDPNKASFKKDKWSKKTINADDFISSCYADEQFENCIKGKRIAVVGDGDTANCVMEYLLPLVYPNANYGFYRDAPFLPEHVYWIGQRAKNVQDFGLKNKHRYCHSGGLVEFFWHGEVPFDLPADLWRETKARITCVPEKLVSLAHKADLLALTTEMTCLEVDLVIDCTGRANALSETLLLNNYAFLKGNVVFYGGHWDEDLDQFVISPVSHTARKIACQLIDERIFLIGSACPPQELIDDKEAMDGALKHLEHRTSLTNSKWSLEHTLPRSAAFANMFADTLTDSPCVSERRASSES